MSDLTYSYKPYYRARPFIPPFGQRQISFFLMLYNQWRHSSTRGRYSIVREELARMFRLDEEDRQVSVILAEINQVRPNFRSFANMHSSRNEQIEDILDLFREQMNEGTHSDEEDEEYRSYATD